MSNVSLTTKRKPPGRPTKFTTVTRRRLIEAVAKGLPFRHACAASGLSYSIFCDYRNAHAEFNAEIEKAVACAIEKRLAIIEKAANLGDVGCAKWLLEHLHPENFARNRIEVTGADGSPLTGIIAIFLPAKDAAQPAANVETMKAIAA